MSGLPSGDGFSRELVNAIPDSILRVSTDGRVVEQLTQSRLLKHAVDDSLADFLPAQAAQTLTKLIENCIQSGVDAACEIQLTTAPLTAFEARVIPQNAASVLMILRDVSERIQTQQTLRRLEDFSEITGLPKRKYFRAQIETAIHHASERNHRMSLIAVDLDRFHRINDTLGHHVGDQVLAQIAERLKDWQARWTRLSGRQRRPFLAHTGGDHFGLLIPMIDSPQCAEVAIASLRSVLTEPIIWNDHEFVFSFSAGITLYPQDGTSADELLQRAESASYQSKRSFRNSHQFHTDRSDDTAFDQLQLERELRVALDTGQLHSVYQPKIDLKTGRCVSAEALARWNHPTRGTISPVEFIPLAEELGLTDQLARLITRNACEQIAFWRRAHGLDVAVAVNFSGQQFWRSDVVSMIAEAISEYRIPPNLLEVELTESVLMQQHQETIKLLNEVKELGVTIAVDDFGTGYSSLGYLKRFPLDKLKIDQSFVADLDRSEDSQAIVAAVIALGHSLKLKIVAEGVERRTQLDALVALGCDEGQGYLFARPTSPDEIPACARANYGVEPEEAPRGLRAS